MGVVKTVRLNIVTDPGDSKAKLDAISRKADELGKQNPDVKIKVDDIAAKLKLDVLRQELRSIGNGPDVQSGSMSGWDRFNIKLNSILGSSGGGAGGAGASGLAGITAIGPAAMTGIAVAAAAAAVALAPVAAAIIPISLGFGGLAVIAKNTLSPVFTALGEHGKELAKTWKTMSEQQKDLYNQALPLKKSFGDLAAAVKPEIYKAFSTGLRIIKDLMPALKPLVIAAGQALDTFLKHMSDWLSSPQGQSFIHWLKTVGPEDIKNFGRVMWDIAHTVGDALHFIYSVGSWVDRFVTRWGDDWQLVKDTAREQWDQIKIGALRLVVDILNGFSHIPLIGGQFAKARDAVRGELGKMTNDAALATQRIQADWNSIHGRKVNIEFTSSFVAAHGVPVAPGGAKGMFINAGQPGVDDQLIRVQRGELVVPTRMVNAGAVDHLRGRIPGFAAGGMVGDSWSDSFRPSVGALIGQINAGVGADENAMSRFVKANPMKFWKFAPPPSSGGGFPGGGPGGGAPGANAALARSMMPAWGSGSAWAAWNAVAMRESGWSQYANNASSGAYGIPQALPFTKMPKAAWPSWAGGSSNPAAQIGWMISYIAGRYGSPQNAWAHELSAGWYDHGGFLPPGASIAINGTGRPEPVGYGGNTYHVTVNVPPTANMAEVGRHTVTAIKEFEKRSGSSWRRTP